jgi:poly(A) polymerase
MKAFDKTQTFARLVVEKLQKAGFESYFAGGCVRDLVMGRKAADFDVATSALPDEVREIFSRTVEVGEAFNVIIVLSDDEKDPIAVEVATFRKDVGIKDGRHPERVERATVKEDVERRDFTINGMLYDPIREELLDWVGGQDDLKRGLIRSIGKPTERIDEDYLRMLRAVRFSARFQFEIDAELKVAIQEKAAQIKKISAERIFDELTRMLTSSHADEAFENLADLGLLQEILPEALPMKGCEQPPEYHPEGDVWVHTMLLLKQLNTNSPRELAWGCLLHDIAKPPTFSHEPGDRIRFNGHAQLGAEMSEKILKRFKAPRRFTEVVCELVNDHLRFADVKKMKASTLKRFLRNPNFHLHLEMHRIDCLASHQNLEIYKFCESQLKSLAEEDLRPQPLLRGQDLIDMGFEPGPLFKEILQRVETEQLEGRLSSSDEAKNFVNLTFAKI